MIVHFLPRQGLVAHAGDEIDDITLLQLLIVVQKQLVGGQQGVLHLGNAVGGKNSGQQLAAHFRFENKIVDAAVEGFRQGVLALLGGEQDDVGEVVYRFIQLTNP